MAAAAGVAALVAGGHRAFAQQPSVCSAIPGHMKDTVIVFQPPSTFTICRDGSVQDDVVTGRRVYFELVPTPGSRMFNFRIHGQASEWTPTGLATWQELAFRIAGGLHDLEYSSEPLSSLAIPAQAASGSPAPLQALAAARSRYLGVVTPHYVDVLQGVRIDSRELPVIAGVVRQWCGELGFDAPASLAVGAELRARCAGPELGEKGISGDVATFEAAAKKFDVARLHARDLTVDALAHPDDQAAVQNAVHAIEDARRAASTLVTQAGALRDSSRALGHDLATLRSAIRSIDAIRPGVPMYLSTYSTPGNAELEIDATPVDIGVAGDAAEQKTAGKTTARFPVVGRHYLDLELGLGITGGLPGIPSVNNQTSSSVIQSRPVDEFVGLGLVELEPARFLWPDKPLAGVLRLPVLGIPFTRDPTQNFFVGAGLGWTGVGSLVAGPYLLRELTLNNGYSVGQTFPGATSMSVDTVAEPKLQVGYFVSASVDVLGLFHLFVPQHTAAIDAATGKEKK